jgi:hypothetical protein
MEANMRSPKVGIYQQRLTSGTFAAYTPGQLYVFGMYGHALSVEGTQVSVLEQPNQIRFRRLL